MPSAKLIRGTARDGIWACTYTLPKWSSPGAWNIWFGAWDYTDKQTEIRAQNDGTFMVWKIGSEPTYETGLGTPHITQIGSGDNAAPEISGISLNRSSVNTSSTSQKVIITARLTDDLSGIKEATCTLERNGNSGNMPSAKLIRGTARDGIWACTYTLPVGSSRGNWNIWFGAWDNTDKQTEIRAQNDGTFMVWKIGSEPTYVTGLGALYVTNG
jgi:hypothetical protein